jgi:succinate dehydrogenase/fumarate reductase-like Fe-S protein
MVLDALLKNKNE